MSPRCKPDNNRSERGRYSAAELDPQVYIGQARRLRAEAISDGARGVGIVVARALHRLTDLCRRVLLAVADGVAAARRYERLAATSDAELARLGLTRGDAPWFAFSGERRAQPSCGPDSTALAGAGRRQVDARNVRRARLSAAERTPAPTRRAA